MATAHNPSSEPARSLTILYAEPLPGDLSLAVAAAIDAVGGGHRLMVAPSKERAELLRLAAAADVIVVATTRVDDALLAAAPRLRHVQHQGVGYDNIDVPACTARGVSVALTPEGTTTGVAEHTFLLLLALYKRLREAEGQLRAGKWPVWELRSMQRSALLLTTARGPLVDEGALVRALRERWIAGAGLDVFEREPAAPDNPLLRLENVVVTPHISAGTIDAFRTKMHAVATNVARVARGEAPLNAVS